MVFPFGATIFGALYIRMFFKLKVKACVVTGALWVIYSIYEYLMYIRILCSGECNIRIDLLIIYPVLIGLSLASTFLFYLKKTRLSNVDE